MQTLEVLDKKIRTAEELLSVVKTMKSLAAVNIRQYERAVVSLEAYRRVVDQGWQALFRYAGVEPGLVTKKQAVVIVIGSDQGMCGQFNDIIAARALAESRKRREKNVAVTFWCVGERLAAAIDDGGDPPALEYQAPGSLTAVHHMVGDMIGKLERWQQTRGTESFYLCHNALSGKIGYEQTFYPVLPLDKSWMRRYQNTPWPSKCIPLLGLSGQELFRQLFRQYLYVSLYRALVQSLAGENSARLAAMQSAEKNIDELQGDLKKLFREQRQMNITNELLDIISGFEVLKDRTAL